MIKNLLCMAGALALSACSWSGPAIHTADGSTYIPPSSILENTAYEKFSVQGPNGVTYTVEKVGKNQSLAASQLLLMWNFPAIAKALWPSGSVASGSAVVPAVTGAAVGGVGGYMIGKGSAPASGSSPIPPLQSSH